MVCSHAVIITEMELIICRLSEALKKPALLSQGEDFSFGSQNIDNEGSASHILLQKEGLLQVLLLLGVARQMLLSEHCFTFSNISQQEFCWFRAV